MTDQETILRELYAAVLDGDEARSRAAAQQSLAAGIPPIVAVQQGLTPGIREVGDRFGRMELFLPEMVLAASAMEAAITILEPHFAAGDRRTKARMVIGAVKGDIHDIGKNIAIALLRVNGYDVVDLGRDVPSTQFVDEAVSRKAQVIGLSGLLTTSLPMMRDVVQMLEEDGIRDQYRVIIGGGPTSQEFADSIGADGYAATAQDGVILCDRWLGSSK